MLNCVSVLMESSRLKNIYSQYLYLIFVLFFVSKIFTFHVLCNESGGFMFYIAKHYTNASV